MIDLFIITTDTLYDMTATNKTIGQIYSPGSQNLSLQKNVPKNYIHDEFSPVEI